MAGGASDCNEPEKVGRGPRLTRSGRFLDISYEQLETSGRLFSRARTGRAWGLKVLSGAV